MERNYDPNIVVMHRSMFDCLINGTIPKGLTREEIDGLSEEAYQRLLNAPYRHLRKFNPVLRKEYREQEELKRKGLKKCVLRALNVGREKFGFIGSTSTDVFIHGGHVAGTTKVLIRRYKHLIFFENKETGSVTVQGNLDLGKRHYNYSVWADRVYSPRSLIDTGKLAKWETPDFNVYSLNVENFFSIKEALKNSQ